MANTIETVTTVTIEYYDFYDSVLFNSMSSLQSHHTFAVIGYIIKNNYKI